MPDKFYTRGSNKEPVKKKFEIEKSGSIGKIPPRSVSYQNIPTKLLEKDNERVVRELEEAFGILDKGSQLYEKTTIELLSLLKNDKKNTKMIQEKMHLLERLQNTFSGGLSAAIEKHFLKDTMAASLLPQKIEEVNKRNNNIAKLLNSAKLTLIEAGVSIEDDGNPHKLSHCNDELFGAKPRGTHLNHKTPVIDVDLLT